MARKYYAGEASHFLLYNNIYDLVRSGGEYISLPNYLQRELVGTKHLLTYNRSDGIKFGSSEAERAFAALLRVADPLAGRDAMKQLPKDPARALPLIEHFLLYGDQIAVIVSFLDTIIPAGDTSYMSGDDRTNFVTFQRWITSSRLLKKDNIVILIADRFDRCQLPRGRRAARIHPLHAGPVAPAQSRSHRRAVVAYDFGAEPRSSEFADAQRGDRRRRAHPR
jgi:hypothetical protein